MKLELNQVVKYKFPGVSLVQSEGISEGKIVKFCKRANYIMVEDTVSEPQHKGKLYKHLIHINQIQS